MLSKDAQEKLDHLIQNYQDESYQDTIEFGNLFPDYNNSFIFRFSICKEYTLDNTYDFFKRSKNKLDKTIIVIKHSFKRSVEEVISFLNQFEDYLGWEKSTVKNQGAFNIIYGSPLWSIAPPILSLYTALIRTGFKIKSVDNIFEQRKKKSIEFSHPYSDNRFQNDYKILTHIKLLKFLDAMKKPLEFLGK